MLHELTASQLVAIATHSDTGLHNRLDLIHSLVPPHYICNGYISVILCFVQLYFLLNYDTLLITYSRNVSYIFLLNNWYIRIKLNLIIWQILFWWELGQEGTLPFYVEDFSFLWNTTTTNAGSYICLMKVLGFFNRNIYIYICIKVWNTVFY